MIGRTAGRQGLDTAEAQTAKIETVDIDIDHPNRIVFPDPVFQPVGKQRRLVAVHTLDETLHPILLPLRQENHISERVFTHSGSTPAVITYRNLRRLCPRFRT